MKVNRRKILALLGLLSILVLGAAMVGTVLMIHSPESWKRFFAWQMHAEYVGSDGVVLQDKKSNCGPAALKMILDVYNVSVTIPEIEQQVAVHASGSTMLALKEMAELKGLRAQGWRFTLEDFLRSRLPAILFVKGDHFVVADSVSSSGTMFIRDPALTMVASALPANQVSTPMSRSDMELTQGGLSWGCWIAIAGMAAATAGAAVATGGVAVIIIGQIGLYTATASLVASCVNG